MEGGELFYRGTDVGLNERWIQEALNIKKIIARVEEIAFQQRPNQS